MLLAVTSRWRPAVRPSRTADPWPVYIYGLNSVLWKRKHFRTPLFKVGFGALYVNLIETLIFAEQSYAAFSLKSSNVSSNRYITAGSTAFVNTYVFIFVAFTLLRMVPWNKSAQTVIEICEYSIHALMIVL